MSKNYTIEKNVQMLLSLMKSHGIRKIIASPGIKNYTFVGSVQQDSDFEVFSVADERSAAYIACGMAVESGEPVALSCTGATASRNYIPALTEAYYRKIPVLAITSMEHLANVGQNLPQVIDRSNPLNDIAKMSISLPMIHSSEDEWIYGVRINDALLELTHNGGGPVHINIATSASTDFSAKILPKVKTIRRVKMGDRHPQIPQGKVAVLVGAHRKWSEALTNAVDQFCEKYNAIVLCDHTSNYPGKYKILPNIITYQNQYYSPYRDMDLLIDIGDISGGYLTPNPSKVWRVNPDGMVRDTYRKLEYVFEMEEEEFFSYYASVCTNRSDMSYFKGYKEEWFGIKAKVSSEMPFSNVWIASVTAKRIPSNSVLHLAILNSLRAWNYFEISSDVNVYSNTGGFGIDGCLSSLVGASFIHPDKLYFGVIGDLAFFYDMNALGNRHIGSNIRLLVINNGKGTEFRQYNNRAAIFGDEADQFIAAAGHYGNKSGELLKHYASDLGFTYMSACNKEEYLKNMEIFVSTEKRETSIVFEIFTNHKDESDALFQINNLVEEPLSVTSVTKKMVKGILGEKGVEAVRKVLDK